MKRLRTWARCIDWRLMAWYAFGYFSLLFFTALFAIAVLMGRQSAACQTLLICTVLLYLLPPHKR